MGTILFGSAKISLLTIFIVALANCTLEAQTTNVNFPSYILSVKGNNNVELHHHNSNTGYWNVIGNTGKGNIWSIAIANEQIYAVAGGTFGTLNKTNGQFIAIGDIGTANGLNGPKVIDNIYGLTYNENDNYFYATHRISGKDLLLKINPANGKVIKNSLQDANGNLADYKMITISTFYFGQYYTSKKFNDLAYDNSTGSLYLSHNYYSTLSEIIELINVDSQNYTKGFKLSPIQKLFGIAFDKASYICGTFSDNRISEPYDVTGPSVVNTFIASADNTIDPSKDSSTYFFGLDFERCVTNLNINAPLTTANSVKFAASTITSNISVNKNATFIAGDVVALNNSFQVAKHITFEAKIDNLCN